MLNRAYQVGDPVIYRKTKHSTCPGPRAEEVSPSEHGEHYSYLVDKFWTVVHVGDDNTIVVRTRRGKHHTLDANTPNLRRANLWQRFWYKDRFPALTEPGAELQIPRNAAMN